MKTFWIILRQPKILENQMIIPEELETFRDFKKATKEAEDYCNRENKTFFIFEAIAKVSPLKRPVKWEKP